MIFKFLRLKSEQLLLTSFLSILFSFVLASPVQAQTTLLSLNGIQFQTKTTGGATGNDWCIWSEGYIENGLNFPTTGTYQFQIQAYGEIGANVWPNMELRIDQKVIQSASVNSSASNVKTYSFSAPISAGAHKIEIAFTNDYYGNGEDRNLYVRHLNVIAPAASTALTEVLTLGNGDLALAAQPGKSLTFQTRFNAVPMDKNYSVFVHFVNSSGSNAFGADYVPSVATTQWSGLVTSNRTVTVPATLPDGVYSIRMGLYEAVAPYTNRAKLTPGSGVTEDNELRYLVGTLTVGSAAPDPTPTPTPAPTYSLTIASPASGATVSGSVQIKGSGPGFKNVEVLTSNGTMLARAAPDTSGNFTATVDTTKLSNGSQTLTIDAWDSAAGQPFTHSAEKKLSLNVQNGTAPAPSPSPAPAPAPSYSLTITAPASGATVNGSVQVKGTGPGFKNVEIMSASGSLLARTTPDASGNFAAAVDTTKLSNGSQSLTIEAWDSPAGSAFTHTDKKALSLNVQNAAPAPAPSPTPTNPAINYFGRFDYTDPAGPRYTWSNSAIVAQFTGTSVSVTLNNSDDQIYFSYVIDNLSVKRFATSGGTKTYTLATGLASGTHKIQLFRDNEGYIGITQFLGFSFGGGQLQAPPTYASNVRLEVIGDSNACGYGDLGQDPCSFSNATESAYSSYPQQTALLLGARPATNICYSGIGVYQNWGYNGPNSGFPAMPTYYTRTLTNSSGQYSFPTDANSQPNVVVIQLGGNDFWDGTGPSQSNFVNAYINLAKTVRAKYPNAYIFAASSPMNSSAKNFIQIAVNQLKSSGESKIQFIDLYDSTAFTNMGCNGHPNVKTQQNVANQLANAIRALGY